MNRFVLFFVAVLMTVSSMADTTIPTNINGVSLGKTTKGEVNKIFTSNGLVFSQEASDSINYVHKGICQHENMQFETLVTRYLNDTLVCVCFSGKCNSDCRDYGKPLLQKIHSKYDHLQLPDSSLYYKLLTDSASNWGLTRWGRTDGHTLVITMSNDTICKLIYFAKKYMEDVMFDVFYQALHDSDPNYAEENKVYGVAGVKFGDNKETVRRVINAKAQTLLNSDEHSLNYYKVKIGGVSYDYATFFFTGGKGLVSVNLQSTFYSWRREEAIMDFENVMSQYSRKYSNLKLVKDEPDEKLCFCGAYIDGYDYLPITITFSKALSQGGDIRYYVQVDYYYMRRNTLYDDEI